MSIERSISNVEPLAAESIESVSCAVVPLHGWYLPVKMVVEWLAALVLLVLMAPVLLMLAALVRLTSAGPAFYSQARVGRGGRVFLMHKLRTMHHDCEVKTGPVWSSTSDSRVTRVGRVLRSTHLDELPQLLNVVQGHMSLIGPRPERPELCALIQTRLPRFNQRLYLRPGLTGLAQTQLAADVALHTVRRKLEFDLYYVRQVNPWLDMRIALSTVLYMVSAMFHAFGRLLVSRYSSVAHYDSETGQLISDEPGKDEPEMPVA